MHDPVYHLGVAWRNRFYNPPPHLGYFPLRGGSLRTQEPWGKVLGALNDAEGVVGRVEIDDDGVAIPNLATQQCPR